MRNRFIFMAVIIFNITGVFGQTISEIETKYGQSEKVYSLGSNIWMSAEYAADGQVCRMNLFPKRVSGNNVYLFKELPFEDFKNSVDLLVPLDKRGARKEPFESSAHGAGVFWTIFAYEKVTIQYSVDRQINFDPLKPRKTFVFSPKTTSSTDKNPKNMKESKASQTAEKGPDSFPPYRAAGYEIVTIRWNDRRCAKN